MRIRPLPRAAFAAYVEQINRYARREAAAANEETKAPQRADVFDFVTQHWPVNAPRVRVLSMPSSNWRFEKSLLDFDPRTRCIAIERHWTVIARGLYAMPGFKRTPFSLPTAQGASVEGLRSECAQITYLHASAYLGLGRTAFRSKAARRDMRGKLHMLHAAWLDFQSPLCWEVVEALRLLPARIDAHAKMKRFPVVVTMMAAREAPLFTTAIETLGGREKAVLHALDCTPYMRAHYVGSKQYRPSDRTPMLAVFVELEPCASRFLNVKNFFRDTVPSGGDSEILSSPAGEDAEEGTRQISNATQGAT